MAKVLIVLGICFLVDYGWSCRMHAAAAACNVAITSIQVLFTQLKILQVMPAP